MIATTASPRAALPSAAASARPVLELADSHAWSAEVGRAGIVVRLLSGTIWLTREGDAEDHVLSAPAVFTSANRGRLALMAIGPARVAVEAPRRRV
jgi:hypothetical protein